MKLRSILLLPAFTLFSMPPSSHGDDIEARLRMARQIARERNDPALVGQVDAADGLIRAGADGDAIEAAVRSVESAVGIDPGGWSMAGQPLFRPLPGLQERSAEANLRLQTALDAGDHETVRAVTRELISILDDQAGVPDGRRPGVRPAPFSLNEAQATKLFLAALETEGGAIRQLSEGRPLPHQMLRFYAYLLEGAVAIRPAAARHQPEAVARLDRLVRGVAGLLVTLQQPDGHFPFPDLRGKNIRFGQMIESKLAAGRIEIRDGWVVTPDPDGGSQFDTGRCGVALLMAAGSYGEESWRSAGLKAADWALAQGCVTNFNYNAFSVSLLCHAWRASGEAKYLDGAVEKFRLGVAPGQAPNGRWLDAHNARTVYHVIILRSLGDLFAALPADRMADRAEIRAVAAPALAALCDEFDAMGITVECLPELLALRRDFSDDARLRAAISTMAASLVEKCTDGRRFKLGAQPDQLAAVTQVPEAG